MRKNKTINANLRNDKVLALMESNMRTYCSLHEIDVATLLPEGTQMKDVVTGILEQTKLGECRASKMELEEFLVLLEAFHKCHIHFK